MFPSRILVCTVNRNRIFQSSYSSDAKIVKVEIKSSWLLYFLVKIKNIRFRIPLSSATLIPEKIQDEKWDKDDLEKADNWDEYEDLKDEKEDLEKELKKIIED